jgi:DNA-binding response OmpR family regulator
MKKRILIVEDDDAIALLLQRLLKTEYDVGRATDGVEALAALRLGPLPSLLLLDVNMPKLDGFSVARNLRSMKGGARVPIIFMTGLDGAMDVIKGIQHGAKHYVTKPFQPLDLLAKIKKTVRP